MVVDKLNRAASNGSQRSTGENSGCCFELAQDSLVVYQQELKRRQEFPLQFSPHPLQLGQIFCSPGGHFSYRVIGPCCRLFDREQLPWPCCRLEWRGKEPSWRRIGKRFIADVATKNSPSYCVEILGPEAAKQPFVTTLYWVKLSAPVQEWWHSGKRQTTLELAGDNIPGDCV
ncbi:MAG: hypothetical protein JOZ78_23560 [Chroococcidiopsidaceae cyanobacterium CP_BM_ER_R8_30]|nr:hypothetical protein [Chroococcidiopsidaceae cyanobacterium CP_BM_ER_R8_30]